MIRDLKKNKSTKRSFEFNNLCEECKIEHESVKHNLILINFKICDSCKISKTIFPI
jgi:hypothetical protein